MKYDPVNKIMVEDNKVEVKDNALSDIYSDLKKNYPEINIQVSSFKKNGKALKSFSLTNIDKDKIDRVKRLVTYNIKKHNAKIVGSLSITRNSIGGIFVEDYTKDSKTKDLEKPYFDPLYKDTRRAIVKEAENYLSSKGYNNSTGKYDKAIFGVRSLLEKTLLQPGTDKFNDAVHKEADRLLKKYNLIKDSKTVDAFDKVDIKAIFGNTDRRWLKAKNDIKNAMDKTNDIKSLEKLYDDVMDYNEIYDDYIDIWNEVGKYAQDKRRQCINELSEMKREIFKKISKLDKEQK